MILVACVFLIVTEAPAQGSPATNGVANAPESSDAKKAEAVVDRATGLALQGDAASAAKAFADAPASIFNGGDADFRACMINRFGPEAPAPSAPEVGDPWIAALAKSYMNYWQRALTKPTEREQAETDLRNQIGTLLSHPVSKDSDLDAAEDEITAEALKRDFHVLLGRTPPLRELMLWKKLTVEQRQVSLPEGPHRVTVNLLDDFILRGWGYYATCSQRSAGGWTTDNALFAVVPAYGNLDGENFLVNFVAHETQHFADKHSFPGLASWELEYRAKLVELALADSTQGSTLQLICENRSDAKDSPHAFADFHVINDLAKHLGASESDLCERKTVAGQLLRNAAKEVLLEDSRQRVQNREAAAH